MKSIAGGHQCNQTPESGFCEGLCPIQEKTGIATETSQQQDNCGSIEPDGRSKIFKLQDDIVEYNLLMKGSNESRKEVRTWMRGILMAKNITRICTWNVRTAYDTGKLAQKINEMKRYKLGIPGSSEMKWWFG